MSYTTEELIKIIEEERKACLKGERLNLKARVYEVNPIVDKFFKPEGIQKFTAYQDFKETVHRYQHEHQVSGIVWRSILVGSQAIRFPTVHYQLAALPSDLELLGLAKGKVLEFWQATTAEMDLYLATNAGKEYRQISPTDVEAIATGTEWANLYKWEKNTDFLEIVLQLGWGQPASASYRQGWPDNGSEYIHAVKPGRQPIC
ncbi:MAG: hypothetical protein F6J93_26035 [Oscillatoria sp. SIO1A7]|nr:hypothetical protein [Oscillatoria sp. SIO1A7]